MQLLPHLEQAVIPVEKLRDYALNLDHPEGRNKAIVFRDLLAIEQRHADVIAELIRTTLPHSPARPGAADEHGDRWTTYHSIVGLNGQLAVVTVAWIIRKSESKAPSLVTCYIESKRQDELLKLFGSI
jgi:hypothetical protein